MRERAGDEIIRKTGGPASFNHGPKILWWKHERPETLPAIVSFVQPGWLCGDATLRPGCFAGVCRQELSAFQRFCRQSARHDGTNRSAENSGFRRRNYRGSSIRTRSLAALRADGRRGAVDSKPGVPVVAGCGDTAASFLACGATREGVCVDVAGTASVFAATTRQFKADTTHRMLGWGQSATPGLWHPYAYINGGGMNLDWFAGELAQLGKARTEKTLAQLNRLAGTIEPSLLDPFFVPHLGGRVSPSQPSLRGSWAGLTWTPLGSSPVPCCLGGCGTGILRLPRCTSVGESGTAHA